MMNGTLDSAESIGEPVRIDKWRSSRWGFRNLGGFAAPQSSGISEGVGALKRHQGLPRIKGLSRTDARIVNVIRAEVLWTLYKESAMAVHSKARSVNKLKNLHDHPG